MVRLLSYPLFFAAGWLFNYFFDVRFAMGFAMGWLAHTWLGGLIW
jgi:hypothetical protein